MSSGLILAELYAKSSKITSFYTSKMLKKYKHFINWPERPAILEFGFGDGGNNQKSLRHLLPGDYREYVATDISEKMMEFAKQNVVMPRMTFKQLAIDTKDIPKEFKNRFDVIISFFTNHLVENPKQMFKNIYTMLKPGGQTFQITFDRSPLNIIFIKLSTHPKWRKYGTVISPYAYAFNIKQSMGEDMKAAGLKNINFEIENCVYEYENEEEWKGLYIAGNPLLVNIPAEEREEYIQNYYNEVKRHVIFINEDFEPAMTKFKLYTIHATKST